MHIKLNLGRLVTQANRKIRRKTSRSRVVRCQVIILLGPSYVLPFFIENLFFLSTLNQRDVQYFVLEIRA